MKNFLFSLFAVVLVAGTLSAQDAEASYKEANKSWKKYAVAGGDEKMDLLTDAAAKMDMAMKGASQLDEKKSSKIYKLRGDIYNELAVQSVTHSQINPEFEIKDLQAAIKSYNSYKVMYDSATKKYAKRDATEGMKLAAGNMRNLGSLAFQKEDYENSYHNFSTLSGGVDFLKEIGAESNVFATEKEYNENLLYAALTANAAGMTAEARPIIERLYKAKFDDAGVYENMFKIYQEENEEKAMKVLAEGREKYPENQQLLIAEINYYMQNDKLDELVGKLEKAIELDPENVSFHLALGNTYDNLTQREMAAGNMEKSKMYFEKAMKSYESTAEIEPENTTAVYSMGALYYNKAASLLKELAAMEEAGDYSKTALETQKAKRMEIAKEFDNALPFFQKAEVLEPGDMNTMLALKEIYARKDDFETSNIFKERIKKIEAKEPIEESYFKNKQ